MRIKEGNNLKDSAHEQLEDAKKKLQEHMNFNTIFFVKYTICLNQNPKYYVCKPLKIETETVKLFYFTACRFTRLHHEPTTWPA